MAYLNNKRILMTCTYEGGTTGTSLKAVLDATHNAISLFQSYSGSTVDNLISYNDTENVTNMQSMFRASNIVEAPNLNTRNVTNMQHMFYTCSSLKVVPAYDVSNVTSFGSGTVSGAFYGCSNLEEIHMTGMKVNFSISASTKFTESALVEILNNLATVSSTQTLTMGATNLAKLTEQEKAIATNKGWTLA